MGEVSTTHLLRLAFDWFLPLGSAVLARFTADAPSEFVGGQTFEEMETVSSDAEGAELPRMRSPAKWPVEGRP